LSATVREVRNWPESRANGPEEKLLDISRSSRSLGTIVIGLG
jgi:hypothetical protein